MIKYVLFDLDGTLLPMDQEAFVGAYFGALAKKLAPYGYESEGLVKAIWQGMGAMIKNDGSATNEERFWGVFDAVYGDRARADKWVLDEFYERDFDKIKEVCGFDKRARAVLDLVKERGFIPVLATNPVFPPLATERRMGWAGLTPSDFALFTHYENSRHCKPNVAYYEDILSHLGADATECVMVGNDVREDMVARTLGMRVFLLTPCLINKDGEDIEKFPHGDFDALLSFISGL